MHDDSNRSSLLMTLYLDLETRQVKSKHCIRTVLTNDTMTQKKQIGGPIKIRNGK